MYRLLQGSMLAFILLILVFLVVSPEARADGRTALPASSQAIHHSPLGLYW